MFRGGKAVSMTANVFYTRGDRDAAAGTEGKLVYTAEGDPDTKIIFNWDIPWGAGPDFLDVTVTGPIKIAGRSNFRGDEVVRRIVEIEIRDDEPLL